MWVNRLLFLGIPLSLFLSFHICFCAIINNNNKKEIMLIVNKIVQNTQKETDCWLCSFASCLSIYFQIQAVLLLMGLNWKQQFQSKHDSGWNSYKATHNKELAGDLTLNSNSKFDSNFLFANWNILSNNISKCLYRFLSLQSSAC